MKDVQVEASVSSSKSSTGEVTGLDLVPFTFNFVNQLQGVPFCYPLTVLLDSGSTSTFFSHCALSSDIQGTTVLTIHGATMAGEFQSNQER